MELADSNPYRRLTWPSKLVQLTHEKGSELYQCDQKWFINMLVERHPVQAVPDGNLLFVSTASDLFWLWETRNTILPFTRHTLRVQILFTLPSCWHALALPTAWGDGVDVESISQNWPTHRQGKNEMEEMSVLYDRSLWLWNTNVLNSLIQVHLCPSCAEVPPEAPTLGVGATYLVEVFPPLASSASAQSMRVWADFILIHCNLKQFWTIGNIGMISSRFPWEKWKRAAAPAPDCGRKEHRTKELTLRHAPSTSRRQH
jgi:hypothetical protein